MKWAEDCETMVYDFKDSVIVLAAEDLLKYNAGLLTDKETITPTPDITADVTDKNNCDIACPDGYEFYDENGNLIGNKVMMRPKKPKYPNNFDDCFNTVADELNDNKDVEYFEYKYDLLDTFKQLLICRNAYWKIAGEKLGLSGSWKPNWSDTNEEVYGIQLVTDDTNMIYHESASFTFPTEKVLNEFCKNFKYLIEECKELL